MNKKCFIVSIGSPWSYAGFDWEPHVFLDRVKAEEFFCKKIDEMIDEVIGNNDMNPEEAKEYRDEIRETMTDNYAYDPDDEWAIKIEEGELEC